MPSSIHELIIAASEQDANLYYATRFMVPDPIVYFKIKGRKHLLINDLELDRAKKQAKVDGIHSITELAKTFVKKKGCRPGYMELVAFFAKSKHVKSFVVPQSFPLGYANALRKFGILVKPKSDPFYEKRMTKRSDEIRAISSAIRHVEKAFGKAVGALKRSTVKKGKLHLNGQPLTSEAIKKIIDVSLMEDGCIASHTIVACGRQSVDPHDVGSGPLYANQPIIMDIFPRDSRTRYFADFTRTVVRGKASKQIKEIYRAVFEGQQIAFKMIRPGIDASKIHQAIHHYFEKLGFKTGMIGGRMQGFFHGTGHGLGLDIHELPSIGIRKDKLKVGQVITVEPGLYYKGIGGVRLEDVIVVTKTGCRNLTRFPKVLEI